MYGFLNILSYFAGKLFPKKMNNSNILRILKTFNKSEIKDFGRFVRSEFFNTNDNVTRTYEYLRKQYPEFKEESISKENIYRLLFPGAKYNDGTMRKISFDLTRLAEQYLIHKRASENSFESKINLLTELNERGLDKLYNRYFREAENETENIAIKDHVYYQQKYLLGSQWSRYSDSIRYKVDLHDKKVSYNERQSEKLSNFINYFLLVSMNLYRAQKYQAYTDQFKINDSLLDSIIDKLLEETKSNFSPGTDETLQNGLLENAAGSITGYNGNIVLNVYLYEIMLMNGKDEKKELVDDTYYLKLKAMLMEPSEQMTHDLKFSLYNILLQHCSHRIMKGYSEYINERFELDKIALSQQVYKSISETHFPPPAFASIVRNASEAGNSDWALEFIKGNKDRLDIDNRDVMLNFTNALCSFHSGDHERSLQFLSSISSVKRWEFKSAVKELTLQIFFELSMFVQAHYLADSYRHFLSSMTRNFSNDRIEGRLNYLKNFMILLRIKENPAVNGLNSVIETLNDRDLLIFNRDWLKEKAKEAS
jgi:hypothetical protein